MSIEKSIKNISLIPFEHMPSVSDRLDTEDYLAALMHRYGEFTGFVQIIHMNIKYPEYHNMMYSDPLNNNNILIYTQKGWKEKSISDIFDQLSMEVFDCSLYFKKHQDKIFKNVHIY